ncbi:conserved hypothetical protein [Neospora caninum Liverpool]|uniref:Transmembrane protein n=1 Tax=Neospora caninum (strain Liverpool) TaxID=572307 RepID=F0VN77_NEOCL|nr:conserved hypothetical protein [Neospora caninum Liverpool]CBZ55173.1 conserved hypothetical protein [Neospora caninum Liverpool]CEL69900.1 TPA: hypothetical protein BN1204_055980 [Neospora caninum Liverpool]|eukprot:XP_003885201.1 conserved hypothetical protein [Neospora caninum Liverpool]
MANFWLFRVLCLPFLLALLSVCRPSLLNARAEAPQRDTLYRFTGNSRLSRRFTGSSVSAWKRVHAAYNEVLVLTDIDDTLWCSGGWRLAGKSLGGVDADFLRGQTYPGIGALYFILSAGPHVTGAPVNMFLPTCPTGLASPTVETCEVNGSHMWRARSEGRTLRGEALRGPKQDNAQEHKGNSAVAKQALPPRVGLLTARASTSAMKNITRSPFFYSAVSSALIHGARQMYGPAVEDWGRIRFENNMELLRHVIGGQHSRGRGKVSGFKEALAKFPGETPVFFGDTGERDVEAGAGMALHAQDKLAAVFVHVVFDDVASEDLDGVERPAASLPQPFNLRFNGRRIPSLQLAYDVVACLTPTERKPRSFAELSDSHLYSAGMSVASVLKPLMASYARQVRRHREKMAEEAEPQRRTPDEGVRDFMALPIFFLKYRDLYIKPVTMGGKPPVSSFKQAISRISSGLRFGVAHVVDLQWPEEENLRSVTEIVPVPLDEVGDAGKPGDPGVPFIPYRTALGAGISAFVLEMLTLQDLVNLAVASIRDFRSLGPPQSCSQKESLEDLYSDLRYMLELTGEAMQTVHVENRAILEDGIMAVRVFRAKAKDSCIPADRTEPWTVSEDTSACLALFRSPLPGGVPSAEPAAGFQQAPGLGSIPPEVVPLARAVCTFKDQLQHWLSAGADEIEVLSLEFAVALNQAVEISNGTYRPGGTQALPADGQTPSPDRKEKFVDALVGNLDSIPTYPEHAYSLVAPSLLPPSASGTVNLGAPPSAAAAQSPFLSSVLPGTIGAGDETARPPREYGSAADASTSAPVAVASFEAPLRSDREVVAPSAPAADLVARTPKVEPASLLAIGGGRALLEHIRATDRRTLLPRTSAGLGGWAERRFSHGYSEVDPTASLHFEGFSPPPGGLWGQGQARRSHSRGSGSSPANDCPLDGLQNFLATMRPICEQQKKTLGLASPCAFMSRLLYKENLIQIFADVTSWYEAGARAPFYISKMHLSLDPAKSKLDAMTKKEDRSFQRVGLGVLRRGRGHSTYDVARLKESHRQFDRTDFAFTLPECNPFDA